MSTGILRITIGAPLVALALLAFSIALVIEWLGDRIRTCPEEQT